MTMARLIAASALALALAAPAHAACTPGSSASSQSTDAAPATATQPAQRSSPNSIVERMVENSVVGPDGGKYVEGGPAKPREAWMTPCPQGEEPNRKGACVKADVVQEKGDPGEQKVISGMAQTTVTIDSQRDAIAEAAECK